MNVIFFKNKKNRGFALLLSIILASVVLAIGLSILRISVSQLQLSATSRESELALHASQSLNECLSFWRQKLRTDLKDSALPSSIRNIRCMGADPYPNNLTPPVGEDEHDVDTVGDGYVVRHYYAFQWDNPAGGDPLCSDGELYFMVPGSTTGSLTYPFPYTTVGNLGTGVKTCTSDFCGVLITRGYNRPCDKLRKSIFTVQRELTFEF